MLLGRPHMTTESDTSRREFLGAIGAGVGAGVAAAGSLAASSEAAAQSAAPLKIVDFHNHYIGPVLDPDQPRQCAARGAAGRWRRSTAISRARTRCCPRSKSAGIAARVINTPTAFIEDADGKLPPGAIERINDQMAELGRKASRQALRPCHRRCLQRRRRRARTDARGQGTQASRRVRRERQARSPARRQGDAPDARGRGCRSACRCSCIR